MTMKKDALQLIPASTLVCLLFAKYIFTSELQT